MDTLDRKTKYLMILSDVRLRELVLYEISPLYK
ncbi:MAG: hypothetical protein MjAS7_0843 [Metallosphaera javensis (ex Sakai et al. 2022)]|nr:MAG: hypothetical protein MjAS7_0843 [Metallosphaera javensis (ex Sakai et al. 2022)]